MKSVFSEHIAISPGVCGGKPHIVGHRIRVQDIVQWHERFGYSPDEIISQYSQLTLADIYAALAYYHDHCDQIRQDIRNDEEFVAEMKKKSHSKLIQKLSGVNGTNNTLSS